MPLVVDGKKLVEIVTHASAKPLTDGGGRFLSSSLETTVGIALVTRAGGEVTPNGGE
jgi:hypothetical protein